MYIAICINMLKRDKHTHMHTKPTHLPHNLLVMLISLSMSEACTAATVVMPARPSAVLYLRGCVYC